MTAWAIDLDWKQHGDCRDQDPAIWYPEVGQDADAARRICSACPVRQECLDYAVAHREKFGVWGGSTETDRRRLRRDRRRRAGQATLL